MVKETKLNQIVIVLSTGLLLYSQLPFIFLTICDICHLSLLFQLIVFHYIDNLDLWAHCESHDIILTSSTQLSKSYFKPDCVTFSPFFSFSAIYPPSLLCKLAGEPWSQGPVGASSSQAAQLRNCCENWGEVWEIPQAVNLNLRLHILRLFCSDYCHAQLKLQLRCL